MEHTQQRRRWLSLLGNISLLEIFPSYICVERERRASLGLFLLLFFICSLAVCRENTRLFLNPSVVRSGPKNLATVEMAEKTSSGYIYQYLVSLSRGDRSNVVMDMVIGTKYDGVYYFPLWACEERWSVHKYEYAIDARRRGKKGMESCRDKNARQEPYAAERREKQEPASYVTTDLSCDYYYNNRKERENKGEDNK